MFRALFFSAARTCHFWNVFCFVFSEVPVVSVVSCGACGVMWCLWCLWCLWFRPRPRPRLQFKLPLRRPWPRHRLRLQPRPRCRHRPQAWALALAPVMLWSYLWLRPRPSLSPREWPSALDSSQLRVVLRSRPGSGPQLKCSFSKMLFARTCMGTTSWLFSCLPACLPAWLSACRGDGHPVVKVRHCNIAQRLLLGSADV